MQAVVHFVQGRRADQELHVGVCVAIESTMTRMPSALAWNAVTSTATPEKELSPMKLSA